MLLLIGATFLSLFCALNRGFHHKTSRSSHVGMVIAISTGMNTGRVIVVLVDDDDDLRYSMQFALKTANYQVRAFDNGADALTYLTAHSCNPDLVLISDILMPGLTGVELIRRVRETHPALPVVAITNYRDEETIPELCRAGCDEFLKKPISATDIVEMVARVITNHKGD